jgi:alpha-mannosidase
MHDDRTAVERRVKRIFDERIWPALYARSAPLSVEAWHVPGEPVPVADALAATYEPFAVGQPWGPAWSTTWFRLSGRVPQDWAGLAVEAVVDLGFGGGGTGFQVEGLAYDGHGSPVKGLHPRNHYVPLTTRAEGGEAVDLLVEAAANPRIGLSRPTPLGDPATAGTDPLYRLNRAELAVLDEEVWHLALDLEVLDGLMRSLPLDEPRRHEILRALERAVDVLDPDDVGRTAGAARARLVDVLAAPAHASAHTLYAVGHSHIDSAWLWPLRETRRKAARTFAGAVDLARHYPELVFACSQAQQYAWVKEEQPELFERIRAAVKTGSWVPVGSMWVEADGNMPGGEAMARQLLHGKRFFLEELGVETEEIWLPDSFGYSAAFPQLARLASARWFLTQKMSWNETDRMPHHTFWWEGIDGTRVFTHFPPVDTYSSELAPSELAYAVRNYAEKGRGTVSLVPFGYGDGGGGPTREMLERARRLRDLEGAPRVRIETPRAFIEKAYDEYPDAPVWAGELYLERHRATLTTQARTKAGNRRSEHLLREAELWAATAAVARGHEYPYDELDALWKSVLLLQFHDILAGSSIAWVHREAEETYEQVRHGLEEIVARALAACEGPGPGPRVLNAAPMERREVVTAGPGVLGGGQELSDGRAAAWVGVGPLAAGRLETGLPDDVAPVTVSVEGADTVLDNALLRVRVDRDGLLASVLDLAAGREVLAPGQRGNLLQLHPDLPGELDAWEIDRHYLDRHTDLVQADSVSVLDEGPFLARVEVRRTFGASRVTQTYTLAAGSKRVDVDTYVDWHESDKMLKAAFPLDVHAEWSSAEIQFGHVKRPTHTNTSWDQARFEICAHRWLHVGEPGYGVAVANRSTYGHDVSRREREGGGSTTTVRLSLLRAPHSPDPHTDQGRHRLSYSLVAGADIRDAVDAGYALNLPLRVVGSFDAPAPMVEVDGPSVRVEAVKLADDRSGDVVVRLYESEGRRAPTRVRPGFDCASVATVDLLERPLTEEALGGGGVRLVLRPFEIRTLRLARRAAATT